MTLGGAVQLLVDEVGLAVANRCAHLFSRPAYYNQHTSPLGRRGHLDAAARGDFPAWKVGKLVLARTDDVHRFIERDVHRYRPKRHNQSSREPPAKAAEVDSVAANSLAAAGLGAPSLTRELRRLGGRG